LPQLGGVADELCLLKSLTTDHFNHAPAQLFQHTGFERFGRPGIGSWVSYGLGSENLNLPSYVVFITGNVAGAGNSLWGSGFLPTVHQGVEFRTSGAPVLFLANPKGVSGKDRREIVDGINFLNRQSLADVGDPEINGHLEGIQGGAHALWNAARQGQFRQQLPARPAAGGTRRALRAAFRPRLGSS
jgi:hypothetical protein